MNSLATVDFSQPLALLPSLPSKTWDLITSIPKIESYLQNSTVVKIVGVHADIY